MADRKVLFPAMEALDGVRLGAVSAGVKSKGRHSLDLALIELAPGSQVAGVFTKNAFCAAPVVLAKQYLSARSSAKNNLKHPAVRYLVINSGNANACTGEQGLQDAVNICREVARLAGTEENGVLPFSTGVIGECLPTAKIIQKIPDLFKALSEEGWQGVAEAIMTTDTCPKGATVSFEHDGEKITVSGIAKGSGMIKPNMATMLAFVFTNAGIRQPLVAELLKAAVEQSFNRISVDSDTSTNDACLFAATGKTNLPEITSPEETLFKRLKEAVFKVHQQLAHQIVRDGEGATKFVTVQVEGGGSTEECLQVAYAVAESPLLKTALFASDANWGRIVMAIGKSGLTDLDTQKVNVYLDDVLIVESGERSANYSEQQGQRVMSQEDITIKITLGRGSYSECVWTCDFSHDYVSINADYRS